jgi:hypothetical protein
VSVPVDPGQLTGGASSTPPSSSKGGTSGGKSGTGYTPPPPSVPEEVVPQGHGGTFLGSGSGFFGGALPDVSSIGSVNPAALAPVQSEPLPSLKGVTPAANTKKPAHTTELASNSPTAAQVPVLLAIIAIIALAVVTATYARLYLLRRP